MISWDEFNTVRDNARHVANEGFKSSYNLDWKLGCFDKNVPGSVPDIYNKLVFLFIDELEGSKPSVKINTEIKKLEEKYMATRKSLDKIVEAAEKFYAAEEAAFAAEGVEYGKVDLKCPLCGGKAHSARYKTENCVIGNTFRIAYCESCNYSKIS